MDFYFFGFEKYDGIGLLSAFVAKCYCEGLNVNFCPAGGTRAMRHVGVHTWNALQRNCK